MSETFKEKINKAIELFWNTEPFTKEEINEMQALLLKRD